MARKGDPAPLSGSEVNRGEYEARKLVIEELGTDLGEVQKAYWGDGQAKQEDHLEELMEQAEEALASLNDPNLQRGDWNTKQREVRQAIGDLQDLILWPRKPSSVE